MKQPLSVVYFVDANVPIYAAGQPGEFKEACQGILEAAVTGQLRLASDVEVVQELTHRFWRGKRLRPGLNIARAFMAAIPLLLPVEVADIVAMTDALTSYPHLSPRDALHYAVMRRNGIHHIITADRHFASLPGIICLDPRELPLQSGDSVSPSA